MCEEPARNSSRYGFGTYDHEPVPRASDRFGVRDADAERLFDETAFEDAPDRARSVVPALWERRVGRRFYGVHALIPDALLLAGPLSGLPGIWSRRSAGSRRPGGSGRSSRGGSVVRASRSSILRDSAWVASAGGMPVG
ncbi:MULTISPECIES: hypothetical protein [unclassified Streptomyces]|uniref:Uncharacterized protein n=2 Tax=Streptomyces evansiae TaxID=3075535 RepID=A0ABU2R7X5_9ACTN|nr:MULTISPECIES: hypothetical protein [unclassified Streptomyces]EFL00789.1 predicted protein [Streptomyces sp. SPB78]MDT0412791.1 hypothetical protein [Streptomyces sp. DSM 41979]MYQ57114.1 hypothetical protein [Streptomyces sp. SID4926]SCE59525.1 hypothetical protein GA0115252_17656 [Streptomyces sp. DfronAA-171]